MSPTQTSYLTSSYPHMRLAVTYGLAYCDILLLSEVHRGMARTPHHADAIARVKEVLPESQMVGLTKRLQTIWEKYGRPLTANYCHPVEPDSDLMTVAEYIGNVEAGGYIDDDGMAEAVKGGLSAPPPSDGGWPRWIKPSDGLATIPQDATHIVWFNR